MRKFLTLSLLFILFACQSGSRPSESQIELTLPSGERVKTTLAITAAEQEQGLSGIRPEDFADDDGKLFFNLNYDERHFWMPDTYFDLDLFYLDKDLKVIDLIRKLPHYIGRNNSNLIPRARGVWCRHVLEMKSTSEISQKIKVGDVLKWKGSLSLQETEEKAQKNL
jgi:uncharacterized membrane protein (UPF0127 family)